MAINYNNLAIQQVFSIDCFDLVDGSLLARLNALKNSSWTNNGQIVYAQGGVGNPKIIGFGHSKESAIEATSAVISDGSWGMQTGSGVIELTNTNLIQYSETLVCTANKVTTTYTATGATGTEIKWAYVVNNYGGVIKKLEQASTAESTGKFTYSSENKEISFFTDDVQDGERVLVFYYPNVTSARQIENRTDVFAKQVKAVANTVFLDTCTGLAYQGQLVYYKAKVAEESTFDLAADGDPAVQNLRLEALQSCESTKLWDIFIFNTEDIQDNA